MKKRILYYDILNILSCLCVIALHHNGIVIFFLGYKCVEAKFSC